MSVGPPEIWKAGQPRLPLGQLGFALSRTTIEYVEALIWPFTAAEVVPTDGGCMPIAALRKLPDDTRRSTRTAWLSQPSGQVMVTELAASPGQLTARLALTASMMS